MTSSNLLPSYQLAAIASAAMEGLSVVAVSAPQEEGDRQTAVLKSSSGRRVLAVTATTPEESTSLIIESRLLQLVAPHMGSDVSVSTVVGRFSQGTLSTVFFEEVKGRRLGPDELEQDADLRRRIGQAIACIHLVPAHELEDAGLPFYEASEVRARKLNLLDAAAETGKVPSVLLSRWEDVLEEAGLWRFTPTAVHGDLNDDRFLVDGTSVVVTDWAALTVADPAEDFAWIMSLPAEARRDVFEAYFAELAEHDHPRDTGLEKRALFNAEFAVAEYLMTAVRQKDEERVSTASSLLLSLARRLDPDAAAPGAPASRKDRTGTEEAPARPHAEASGGPSAVADAGKGDAEDAKEPDTEGQTDSGSAHPKEASAERADAPKEAEPDSAPAAASTPGAAHSASGAASASASETTESADEPVRVGISREERAQQRAAHGSHAAGLVDGPATTAQPAVSPDVLSPGAASAASGPNGAAAPGESRAQDSGAEADRDGSQDAREAGSEADAVQARDPESGSPDKA